MTRKRAGRVAAVAGFIGLAVTGCGPHQQVAIGVHAVALDLQFARPDLAKPIPPKVILQLLVAPPTRLTPSLGPGAAFAAPATPPLALPAPAGQCPPDSAPAKPAAALQQSTQSAPAPGYYSYATAGKQTISGGSQNVSAAIPPRSEVAISRPRPAAPDSTVAAEGGAPPGGSEVEYTVTTHLSNTVSQVDELMVSASSINLVQRTLTDGQRTMIFTPTPQVQLMKFGPVGSSWKSSGSDNSSGSVMNYQATITATKSIDVCGQLVRTYQVTYSESLTNPAEAEIIRTSSSDPNTFQIAPQLGGLIVGQHVDTDDIRFQADLSGYVGITLDYTSTVASLTPTAR